MALSDFTGPDYIDDWTRDLDQRWPERAVMAECVVETMQDWCRRTKRRDMKILELGTGAGGLSEAVLSALESGSVQSFIGIDISPELTQHTHERLRIMNIPDLRLENFDLKSPDWPEELDPVDIAYTFQTLHDLGGRDALEAMYRQLYDLLTPGGLLINADFVIPFPKDPPDRPRRFPVETHRALMADIGFTGFTCHLQSGKMACMSSRKP